MNITNDTIIQAYNIPEKIEFKDGMRFNEFLLQEYSERHEQIVQYHASLFSYHWGIKELQYHFDEQTFQFQILKLDALLPDGRMIYYSKDQNQHEDKTKDKHFEHSTSDTETLTIDLSHYKDKEKASVFISIPNKDNQYVKVKGEPIPVKNSNVFKDQQTEEKYIARLRPKIVLDKISNGGLEFEIQVCFQKIGDKLSIEIAYPMLYLEKNNKLYKECETISEKMRSIVGTFDHKSHILKTFITVIPPFEAMLQQERIHPYQLFLSLSSLAGQLAAIEMVLPKKFEYSHETSEHSIQRIIDYIQIILDGIHPTQTLKKEPFDFKEERQLFELEINSEYFYKNEFLIIKVNTSDIDRYPLINWKIASEQKMKDIENTMDGGAELEPIAEKDFEALNLRDEDITSFYTITTHSYGNEFVLKNSKLQIIVPRYTKEDLLDIQLYYFVTK